jgi:hypothetical protein
LENCQINLYIPSPGEPVIESSSNITVGPYNFKYPQLKTHSESAGLIGEYVDEEGYKQTKLNLWNKVFDFTKRDDGVPNFKILESSQFKITNWKELLPDLQNEESED